MKRSRLVAAVVAAFSLFTASPLANAHEPAPLGTRLMHRDMDSSDALPWAGPAVGSGVASAVTGASCSTMFQGSDGVPVGLCTRYWGFKNEPNVIVPSIVVFNKRTAEPIASLELKKTGLLGGVYGFMDEQDRIVMASGNHVVRIAKKFVGGKWVLFEQSRTALPGWEPGVKIAGLVPDGAGNIWVGTSDARIGRLAPDGSFTTMKLGRGEEIANGLTPRHDGVSVLTSHALYEVAGPELAVKWKHTYDRGSARKPGQLSWGSGTTPTFFGTDREMVAIVDNADNNPNLEVLDAATGELVCRMPAFTVGGPGTENSLMASGNSLFIPSTYGFSYPKFAVTGPQKPAQATFTGGLARIDVNGTTCTRVWENKTRFATLPMLTKADNTMWALSTNPWEVRPNVLQVALIGVDTATGKERVRIPVGTWPFDEPLQLTGMITPQGEFWQGSATRMFRVAPGAKGFTGPNATAWGF